MIWNTNISAQNKLRSTTSRFSDTQPLGSANWRRTRDWRRN